MVAALNGQWNVTARREKDFRFYGLAKPGKNQAEGGRIPGNPACQQPPFGLLCQTAPPKNFEDEKKFEHFFNVALQTDYLHGRLEPRRGPRRERRVRLRHPDHLSVHGLAARNRGLHRHRGGRKAGPAFFRDRDQFQFRLTYQLN